MESRPGSILHLPVETLLRLILQSFLLIVNKRTWLRFFKIWSGSSGLLMMQKYNYNSFVGNMKESENLKSLVVHVICNSKIYNCVFNYYCLLRRSIAKETVITSNKHILPTFTMSSSDYINCLREKHCFKNYRYFTFQFKP